MVLDLRLSEERRYQSHEFFNLYFKGNNRRFKKMIYIDVIGIVIFDQICFPSNMKKYGSKCIFNYKCGSHINTIEWKQANFISQTLIQQINLIDFSQRRISECTILHNLTQILNIDFHIHPCLIN